MCSALRVVNKRDDKRICGLGYVQGKRGRERVERGKVESAEGDKRWCGSHKG